MSNEKIRLFIDRVVENDFVSADDVRFIRRDILHDGISSQFVADALLAIDRTIPTDPIWAEFLAPAIVDFVVWGVRPTGIVNADMANWLLTAFSIGDATAAAGLILQGIAEEAQEVDPALLLAWRSGCRRNLAA